MTRWRHSATALTLTFALIVPAAAADMENTDPTVQYRVNVMRGISANAAAIGLTIRNDLPQTQNLALHAGAIALDARAALTAFGPKVPDGVAKPEVWDNWKDFADRLNKLATAADEVAQAARDGGVDAAKPKLDIMLPMCKSCHDTYRKK
jgi:cytochrome c556